MAKIDNPMSIELEHMPSDKAKPFNPDNVFSLSKPDFPWRKEESENKTQDSKNRDNFDFNSWWDSLPEGSAEDFDSIVENDSDDLFNEMQDYVSKEMEKEHWENDHPKGPVYEEASESELAEWRDFDKVRTTTNLDLSYDEWKKEEKAWANDHKDGSSYYDAVMEDYYKSNEDLKEWRYNREKENSEDPNNFPAYKEWKEQKELDKLVEAYVKDLKENSEYPDTIPDDYFKDKKLEKITPEENAKKREEFDDVKQDLKRQWEQKHGIPWPKYEKDVYSSNGKLIRKAGQDYDAHHIQPLSMGGENTADNITPLHAEKHYDSQGVHSPTSPYSQMENKLNNINNFQDHLNH